MKITRISVAVVTSVIAAIGFAPFAFAATGAIYTTNVTCNGVNVNLFDAKTDVYLDGGPQGGGSGLSDGSYYVQVTTPSGTVLGKTVTNSVVVSGGEFAVCYQLSLILYTASSGFIVPGYDNTTNSGGEYKVWASMDPTFAGGTNKTDNFKVKGSQQLQFGSIAGMKFEDMNGNGFKDSGDLGLSSWTIFLDENGDGLLDLGEQNMTTDGSGNYLFSNLVPATYVVCEVLQNGWSQTYPGSPTTPACHTVVVAGGQNVTGKDFGNFHNITISGFKWHDKDSSGTLNNSEPKLSGWTIELNNGTATTSSMITLADGSYSFPDLGPGTYKVCEVMKSGWVQTYPTPSCYTIAAQSGSNKNDANFGNHALYWCSPGFWKNAKYGQNFQQPTPFSTKYIVVFNWRHVPLKSGDPNNVTIGSVLASPNTYGGPAFNSVADYFASLLGWGGSQATGENCPLNAFGTWTAR